MSQAIETIVAAAVARYAEVHATRAKEGKVQKSFTESELRAKITEARITKGRKGSSKSAYKARRASIAVAKEELGLHFYISRNLVDVLVAEVESFSDWDESDNRVYDVKRIVKSEVDPKGGTIFAYRYVPGDKIGSIVLEYVKVKCRDDEVFDPVVGKELAIERFRNEANRKVGPFKPTTPYDLFEKLIG